MHRAVQEEEITHAWVPTAQGGRGRSKKTRIVVGCGPGQPLALGRRTSQREVHVAGQPVIGPVLIATPVREPVPSLQRGIGGIFLSITVRTTLAQKSRRDVLLANNNGVAGPIGDTREGITRPPARILIDVADPPAIAAIKRIAVKAAASRVWRNGQAQRLVLQFREVPERPAAADREPVDQVRVLGLDDCVVGARQLYGVAPSGPKGGRRRGATAARKRALK